MFFVVLKVYVDCFGGVFLCDIVDGCGFVLFDWVFSVVGIELDLIKQCLDVDVLVLLLEVVDVLEFVYYWDMFLFGGIVNLIEGWLVLYMVYCEGVKIVGIDVVDFVV